jgi:hypothetical protein
MLFLLKVHHFNPQNDPQIKTELGGIEMNTNERIQAITPIIQGK